MTRSEKTNAIEELKLKFQESNNFYIADSSTLTVEQINALRRTCFEKDIEVKVVKNTLAIKAMEQVEDKEFSALFDSLKGPSTIFFAEVANAPAKVMKEFRKDNEKPVLKAAYIDSDVFVGDDQIDVLAALKSKEELVGEIIVLLQSPAKNVVSALKSGGSKLAGIVKTLQERPEA